MQPSRDEILNMPAARRDIVLGFGVRRLRLFGSVVRGEATESSDLDFLVEFEKATFDNYFDLKFFLEDLFERPVDLVIADVVKPRLRRIIFEETVYAQEL